MADLPKTIERQTKEFAAWAEQHFGETFTDFLPLPADDSLVSATYYFDDQARLVLGDPRFGSLITGSILISLPTGSDLITVPTGDYRFTQLTPYMMNSNSIISLIESFVRGSGRSPAIEAQKIILFRAVREPEGYSFQLWEPVH